MNSRVIYSWSKFEAQKIVDKAKLKSATIIPCVNLIAILKHYFLDYKELW
jgi:hypothetical protein